MIPTPPLRRRLLPLVLLGLAVGLVRYALEFAAPDKSMYFGVYIVMPVALLVIGIRGTWGAIRWPALAGTMVLMCLLVWGIPNTLSYTTAQFQEWNHGRFYHTDPVPDANRAAPPAATALGKLGWGALQGLLTSIGGTIVCTAVGTLVIWLPGRIRSRREATPS